MNLKVRYFYKFLRKNRCLNEYIYNCRKNEECGHSLKREDILPFLEKHIIIGSAFIWSSTKEGHWFWSRINQKWMSEIEKYRYTLNN